MLKLYYGFQASHLPAADPAISSASGILFLPIWLLSVTVTCGDIGYMIIDVCAWLM